jgi:predicted peptidase
MRRVNHGKPINQANSGGYFMHSIDKVHAITVNQNLSFVLYLPDDYETSGDKQYPFILFLHGAGERGNDISRVKLVGLPKNLERGDNLPFIILAPQCPEDHWWADNRHALITLVDWALANYRVDAARIYLTGLSMGGRGTWDMATLYPNRFAAVAPICGWGDGLFGYPDRVKRIAHCLSGHFTVMLMRLYLSKPWNCWLRNSRNMAAMCK